MRTRIKWAVGCLMFALGFAACGGGGGSDSSQPAAQAWSGPLNASGFPDVGGTYSFVTKSSIGVCSDGSQVTVNPFAFNLTVIQNINSLILSQNSNTTGLPGFTVIDSNQLTGTVDKNGHIIASQAVIGTMIGITGQITINYNLDGNFTQTSWSGNYEYTISIASDGSCKVSATFSGDKL